MTQTSEAPPFLAPGRIGRLTLKNRLVRAATSETMATDEGHTTDAHVRLYRDLAAGGAGLIISGHIYVEPGGQYAPRQLGIDQDARIPGLARITHAVHGRGGVIFAELSHAGSQSVIPTVVPIAPSVVPNAIFAREPVAMSEADIARVIAAFGAAARRAVAAGFDGIHIHSGNGYLLSEFNSPHANRRTDRWGGDAARRSRLILAIYQAVRAAVGPAVPVTARLGVADAVEHGLTVEESAGRAAQLATLGLDGIEVAYGVMNSYCENIRPYVGVTPWRGLADGLVHRLFAARVPEAYYRPFARAMKAALTIPVILVGGLRTTETMAEIIRSGDADFLALARPFVREPDLPNRIAAGKRGPVDCVSCNICFRHEGKNPLQCWRVPRHRLLLHAYKYYLGR